MTTTHDILSAIATPEHEQRFFIDAHGALVGPSVHSASRTGLTTRATGRRTLGRTSRTMLAPIQILDALLGGEQSADVLTLQTKIACGVLLGGMLPAAPAPTP